MVMNSANSAHPRVRRIPLTKAGASVLLDSIDSAEMIALAEVPPFTGRLYRQPHGGLLMDISNKVAVKTIYESVPLPLDVLLAIAKLAEKSTREVLALLRATE